ncbi:MAG: hypothetical protein KME27_23660 [Lyngbya sp. HA4199-MV5]|jgi:hypothetical protein|nr:hypothetical protein [Lyngbya sp. HA4199-MV5]
MVKPLPVAPSPFINVKTAGLQAIAVRSHCADIVLATTCFAAIRQKSSANLSQVKQIDRGYGRWTEDE